MRKKKSRRLERRSGKEVGFENKKEKENKLIEK